MGDFISQIARVAFQFIMIYQMVPKAHRQAILTTIGTMTIQFEWSLQIQTVPISAFLNTRVE